MSFKKAKAARMQGRPVMQIMNALGAIAWSESRYEIADHKMRLLHPATWLLIVFEIVYTILVAIVAVLKELPEAIKHDTVWW